MEVSAKLCCKNKKLMSLLVDCNNSLLVCEKDGFMLYEPGLFDELSTSSFSFYFILILF
jgi:hypothetical protein